MGEETRLEKLLDLIKDLLKESLEENNKEENPEICELLLEGEELCDKLLKFDYFKNSESFVDNVAESLKNNNTSNRFNSAVSKWRRMYNKELKIKKKDLLKLFKLVVECSEDF